MPKETPQKTPQEKIESQAKFSNSRIIATCIQKNVEPHNNVESCKMTVWDIAIWLKIKSKKLQELLWATHFSWIYQKNTKGITELKDPRWFFFSEPRNNDVYTLNHTDQGYTLHRIREGKEFFMVIPNEYIKPHEIDHVWEELALLSKDIKPKK